MNVFMGTYWEVLNVLHDTLGVDHVIVEDKPTSHRVIELARRWRIPLNIITPTTPLAPLFPDSCTLLVVGSFSRILRWTIINRCTEIINFHPGIVEETRGRHTLPINARRGDPFMGVTCHLIEDEEIDAGPVLAQVRIPINYDADFDFNHHRLRSYLSPMAHDLFSVRKTTGRFPAVLWTPSPESYHRPLTRAELDAVLNAKQLADCIIPPRTRR